MPYSEHEASGEYENEGSDNTCKFIVSLHNGFREIPNDCIITEGKNNEDGMRLTLSIFGRHVVAAPTPPFVFAASREPEICIRIEDNVYDASSIWEKGTDHGNAVEVADFYRVGGV